MPRRAVEGGGNRPDSKLLLIDENQNYWPVLIEYKGYKDKLVKLNAMGQVENLTSKEEPNYKNINEYAVNGAIHYANAVLHYTTYERVLSIGVTGYKDATGQLVKEVAIYYVGKENHGVGQEVFRSHDLSILSFLKEGNFQGLVDKIDNLHLSPEEQDIIKRQREDEIEANLRKLNNDIYQQEKGISEDDRVYLVAASIIATLGIPGEVAPLKAEDLKSSEEDGYRDGQIILQKISSFLKKKNLPADKQKLITNILENVLTAQNINKVIDGETQVKRIFTKVVDDLGIYYKIGLTTDFTGKLFNEMYAWLGFSQDKLNDVVLTPSYVATLLARLARVDKDSYVWDFATGSAGLLVAAMNEMIQSAHDAKLPPDALAQKVAHIKSEQLLGLEILHNIYMLAVLNMIMMGDGSSHILNEDSLEYSGQYGFKATEEKFPATAFVLNPPYSAPGNGMVFVEKALSMMTSGYAAVIVQNSAGSGKAVEYNKNILKKNTLLASIKMPIDLFLGKSSVQTYIYVFKVGEAHQADDTVRFIDFSYDGYTRANRKKARSSANLRDTDHAKERYQEVADLVRYGARKRNYLDEHDFYEGTIDPLNGADWNQNAPIDIKPTLEDLKKTVSDYLAWEVSNILQGRSVGDDRLGK